MGTSAAFSRHETDEGPARTYYELYLRHGLFKAFDMLEYVARDNQIKGIGSKRQRGICCHLVKLEINGAMRCANVHSDQSRLGSDRTNQVQVFAFTGPVIKYQRRSGRGQLFDQPACLQTRQVAAARIRCEVAINPAIGVGRHHACRQSMAQEQAIDLQ